MLIGKKLLLAVNDNIVNPGHLKNLLKIYKNENQNLIFDNCKIKILNDFPIDTDHLRKCKEKIM